MAARRRRKPGGKPTGGGGAGNPNSLANLVPGAGAWQPGASPNLKHGLRSRNPPGLLISEVCDEIEAALAESLPIKGPDGGVPGPDVYAVRLAAIALLQVRRCNNYLALHGETDDRGNLRPEFDGWGRAVMRASALLDKLGCSPTSRARLGVDIARGTDLARAMAEDAELERGEREAASAADGDVIEGAGG